MAIFYFAARYSRRDELCRYRADLEQRGHQVPARWLLGDHQTHIRKNPEWAGNKILKPEQAVLFAEDDMDDLLSADVVITFTEEPRSTLTRGGRHVEFGIALGKRRGEDMGAPLLYVVGPYENVFHTLPEVDGVFDNWAAFLAFHDVHRKLPGDC